MQYREMTIEDYDDLIALWQQSEGLRIREADSRRGIQHYLARNPGLSFIALHQDIMIGTIMAGHDGKRGYIQHLTVSGDYRRQGVGTKLLDLCLDSLLKTGIVKSHIFVLKTNDSGALFWKKRGWTKRNDIDLFSYINKGQDNA